MAKKKNSLVKKIMIGTAVTTVGSAAAVALTNQMLLKREKKKIHTYGTKIDTVYGKINVGIRGNGEDTIVLLPGYGTASPILDFEPLANALSDFARVITIEYLGYGDSDDTERERTIENICEEVHLVLEALKVKKCWMMPHSISGVYALAYVNYYPEEVEGLLMIDTSVPKQNEKVNPALETILSKVLHYSGLGRIIMKFKPSTFVADGELYDEYSKIQMKLRSLQKASKAIENEGKLLNANMNQCKELHIPETLPVLLFICNNTIKATKGWWLEIHEEQLEKLETSAMVRMDGAHYLHHSNAGAMADEVENFISFVAESEIFM